MAGFVVVFGGVKILETVVKFALSYGRKVVRLIFLSFLWCAKKGLFIILRGWGA